ncbi:MAG: DUF2391 family protein [Nanobdellota archaeon]
MSKPKFEDIEGLLEEERKEVGKIGHKVDVLKERFVDKTPNKFSMRDVARSFFGAMVVAFGYVLKGATVSTAVRMSQTHVLTLIFASLFILTLEIHYFGCRKIKNKKQRKPLQFILKRLPTFYLVSLIVSAGLVFIYGINYDALITGPYDVYKVIIAVSFPASLGAGLSDLLKKY